MMILQCKAYFNGDYVLRTTKAIAIMQCTPNSNGDYVLQCTRYSYI